MQRLSSFSCVLRCWRFSLAGTIWARTQGTRAVECLQMQNELQFLYGPKLRCTCVVATNDEDRHGRQFAVATLTVAVRTLELAFPLCSRIFLKNTQIRWQWKNYSRYPHASLSVFLASVYLVVDDQRQAIDLSGRSALSCARKEWNRNFTCGFIWVLNLFSPWDNT